MAAWPDTEELVQVVQVNNPDDWTTTLDRVLAAAIAAVKQQVGDWDELTDTPDENQAQAALRMAELISERPGVPVKTLVLDPTFQQLIAGSRRAFPIG